MFVLKDSWRAKEYVLPVVKRSRNSAKVWTIYDLGTTVVLTYLII